MNKQCFKCKKEKPIEEFYTHPGTKDKHLNKCKECAKNDVNKRYNSEEGIIKITKYERIRSKTPYRKEKALGYQRTRRIKYPEKNDARQKLERAVKSGLLTKLPCYVCGDVESQGHHTDYSKPLDVMWLCFKHHRKLHKELNKNKL